MVSERKYRLIHCYDTSIINHKNKFKMNNDIWKFHDWLIDQKNEKKVNESDCDYLLEHIRKTYVPNIENSYVQDNILSAIDAQIEDQYWANDNFWAKILDESNGLIPSKFYKILGKLISYFEKIETLENDLRQSGIIIHQNEINGMFSGMIHLQNSNVYFAQPYDIEDGFLIIFFTQYTHDNDEYMYIFDDDFTGYGLFTGYKSMVDFIDDWKSGLVLVEGDIKELYNDKLSNVKSYLDYLTHLQNGYQS